MKENNAIALDSCYLLIKKNVKRGNEHHINSPYGVCSIRHLDANSRFQECNAN